MKYLLTKICTILSLLFISLSCEKKPEQTPLPPTPEKKILKVDFLDYTQTLISGQTKQLNWKITYSDMTEKVVPSTKLASNNNSIIVTKGNTIYAEHYGNAVITTYLVIPNEQEYSVQMAIAVTPEDKYLDRMEMLRNPNNLEDWKAPIIKAGETYQLRIKGIFKKDNGEIISVILPFNDKRVIKWELRAMNHDDQQEKIFKYNNKTGIIQTFVTDGRLNKIYVNLTYSHPLLGEVNSNNDGIIEIH